MDQAFGLRNSGAICYFNSIYQALISCGPFMTDVAIKARQILESKKDVKNADITRDEAFMLHFLILEKMLSGTPQDKQATENLGIHLLKIVGMPSGQQDAHETLLKILSMCDTSGVSNIFKQKRKVAHLCMNCFYKAFEADDVRFITHLINDNQNWINCNVLNNFTIEKNCEKCNHQKMLVSDIIVELPKVLIMSVEKYKTVDGKVSEEKNQIVFDNEITVERRKYSLVSVIEHTGQAQSGHYYCIAKRGNDWYHFDDHNVKKIDGFKSSEHSYIAFYCVEG